MPLLNASINNSIAWSRQSNIGETQIVENGKDIYTRVFGSGTGVVGKVSKVWYATGGSAGGNVSYDLFALPSTIFDSNVLTSFSGTKIKVIYVENTTTGYGGFGATPFYFYVQSTAMTTATGFVQPFNNQTMYMAISSGGSFTWADPVGYAPSNLRREIAIGNMNTDYDTYSIVIIG